MIVPNHLPFNDAPLKIAIVVGEDSGDLLGADLVKAFQAQFSSIEFMGIAGPQMQKLGVDSIYEMDQLSVIGIWAILKRLPKLLRLRKSLTEKIIHWQPDLFIGIDAPEFNLDLEKKLKISGIKTVHYVSPSVWAWREKRIFKIKSAVDYMLTLFPFETAIYNQHNIPVTCVGHPLAKMLALEPDVSLARRELKINLDAKVLAILPGSRGSEIKFLGELFIEVAGKLTQSDKTLVVVVPLVNERRTRQFKEILSRIQKSHYPQLKIQLVAGQSRQVMCAADVVLLASGTATLEAMLLKKPMIVAYKVSAFGFMIYKKLLTINHFSLPNLLMSKPKVLELMQQDATIEKVAFATQEALKNGLSVSMKEEYRDIHESLKLGGGERAVSSLSEFFQLKGG